MLRPVERIGLYILFAMLVVMLLVLLTQVVWGHDPPDGGKHCKPDWDDFDERDLVWAKTQHWHHNGDEDAKCADGSKSWKKCVADSYNPDTKKYELLSACKSTSDPPSVTTPDPPSVTTFEQEYIPDETCHTWDFTESPYIGFPVLPDGKETIGGFRSFIKRKTGQSVNISLLIDGAWKSYPRHQELKYTPITAHLGVYVGYRGGEVEGCGERLTGETLELNVPEGKPAGLYLIGFPENPSAYEYWSDLVSEDLPWIKRKVWVGEYRNTKNQYVSRYRQDDDTEIEAGQAIVVRVTADLTLDLTGEVPQAPQAQRHQTLTTSWGALKRW